MVHFCLARWPGCCCSCRLRASLGAHPRARQSHRSAVLRMLSPIVSRDNSGNCLLPYQLEKLLSLWAICWAWWPRCCCSCRLRASLVARCRARRVTYQRRFASLLVSSPLSSFPPAPLYLLLSFIFFLWVSLFCLRSSLYAYMGMRIPFRFHEKPSQGSGPCHCFFWFLSLQFFKLLLV